MSKFMYVSYVLLFETTVHMYII